MLEYFCKLKSSQLGSQIFETLQSCFSFPNLPKSISSKFKQLLQILQTASFIDSIVWLEQYLTQNSGNILMEICKTLTFVTETDPENFKVTEEFLERVNQKLKVCVNVEDLIIANVNEERLVVNLYWDSLNDVWFILYTQEFVNLCEGSLVPRELCVNSKIRQESDELVKVLLKVLARKEIDEETLIKIREYMERRGDFRVEMLLDKREKRIWRSLKTGEKCKVCGDWVENISPVVLCPEHAVCLKCIKGMSFSCLICGYEYSDMALTFLSSN